MAVGRGRIVSDVRCEVGTTEGGGSERVVADGRDW